MVWTAGRPSDRVAKVTKLSARRESDRGVRVKWNLGRGNMGVARREEACTSPFERRRMEEWKNLPH